MAREPEQAAGARDMRGMQTAVSAQAIAFAHVVRGVLATAVTICKTADYAVGE